jgi:quinol monooxygenase YgiN
MVQQQDDLTEKGRVRSTTRMLIPLNRQSEALEILGVVSSQVQYEPGCISSRLYRGADEVRAIMIEEHWENNQDILHHLQSDTYRRVLLVMEMAEEPPDIRFDTIAHSGGVEVIENARKQG